MHIRDMRDDLQYPYQLVGHVVQHGPVGVQRGFARAGGAILDPGAARNPHPAPAGTRTPQFSSDGSQRVSAGQ